MPIKLSKNADINEHEIKLIESKQLLHESIFSLNLKELKTQKVYIETHLITRFIQSFMSPASAPILFDKNLDKSLRLFLDYRGLNN